MGCFLKCFGGSKDAKRRKKRNKVNPKNQRHGVQDPPQSIIPMVQSTLEAQKSPTNLVPELRSVTEEQLNPSPRKRVTFNSKVTSYEPVSVYESTDSLVDANKVIEKEKDIVKSRKDNPTVSDDDSCISSVGSYPPNHRYQNYGGSDDEAEEFDDGDLEDEDEDDDDEDEDGYDEYDDDVDGRAVGEVWSESIVTATMESTTKKSLKRVSSEEVNSPFLPEQETKVMGAKGYVRDRSVYVHPVLNPVENLSQWKAVKSKGKENKTAKVEAPRSSFHTEPTFKQSSMSFKPKSNQEVAVDASLSNWLVSPEKSASQGSNSVISFEDRPILGALTVEELKELSATSTPRKSPSRSPDDRPIIGSVGAYWK